MTKHDLKELEAMGAELGAAKAEVERLRGLLREVRVLLANSSYKISGTAAFLSSIDSALSQQSEPVECPVCCSDEPHTGTCGSSDPRALCNRAEAEPAPAQDGREAFKRALHSQNVFKLSSATIDAAEWAWFARPAQTEQQPLFVPEGWLIELGFDVLDRPFRFVDSQSHSPTIKVILPPCEPDDSSSWDLRDEIARRIGSVLAAPIAQTAPQGKFRMGDLARKTSGSGWQGRICGTYSTALTPEGYAVESEAHCGSVQIYPAKALEAVE